MTIRISFLAPYPRYNGERKHQDFATIAEAKNMIDFYDSRIGETGRGSEAQ